MGKTRMLPVLLVCLLYCAGTSLSAPGRSADEVLIGEVDIALRGDADDAGSPRSNPEATSSQPFASKCIVDGKAYSHSQMIPSEDQSSHCLCVAGEVYCWWQTFGGSSAKAAGSSALDNNELLVPASQPLDKAEKKEQEEDDEDEKEEEEDEEDEEEDYSAEGSSELPPEASGESAAAGEQLDDNSVDSDERSDAAEEDDEEEDEEDEDELEESNDVPQAAISNLTTTGSLASATTSTSTTMPGATSAKPTVAPATCLFMGRTYRPGEPLPHSTGNCVECRCGIDGHIECSPRDCVGLRPQRPGGGDLELFDGASNF